METDGERPIEEILEKCVVMPLNPSPFESHVLMPREVPISDVVIVRLFGSDVIQIVDARTPEADQRLRNKFIYGVTEWERPKFMQACGYRSHNIDTSTSMINILYREYPEYQPLFCRFLLRVNSGMVGAVFTDPEDNQPKIAVNMRALGI